MISNVLKRLRQHEFFFYGYLVALTAGIVLWLSIGKTNSFLLFNEYHLSWIDYFFISYTYLGDGLFALLLVVIFFLKGRKKFAIILLLAFSSTGIITQVIKPIVHSLRPETYFFPHRLPFFIDDVIHAGNNSFPSGHTVTAFAVATVLALYTVNRWYHLALLILAILVGFSRIYLSQHFFTDVLAGSLLGVTGGVLCEYWCGNLDEDKLVFRKQGQLKNDPRCE